MRDGRRTLFIIPLIILIVLVIVFRVELLVTGLRILTTVHKSTRAEHYIADYYQNNAVLSQELANSMYVDVLDNLQKRIQTETGDQKAKDAMALGRMYECGKGAPLNLKTAQQWYQVAVDSNTNKENTMYQADLQRTKDSAANAPGKANMSGTPAMSGVCSFQPNHLSWH